MLKIYLIIFRNNYKFQKNKEEVIVIGKNNKKLKELKQGVKVESYSIKKFKFGAASIVIGASIFLVLE